MKYLWITLFLVIIGCCDPNFCFVKDEDITNMYASYVEEWKRDSAISFDKAEKEIFDIKPEPLPDDGTNPDASKCICKGTGIIVQGDGHKTACRYHGKSSNSRWIMNTTYLIYASIGLGISILLTNFIDFPYLISKLLFRDNSTPEAYTPNKQKDFLQIVDLWYQLKDRCDKFKLHVASQKLDEVFPLLNGVLEDEVGN